jgi:hypothetical protein
MLFRLSVLWLSSGSAIPVNPQPKHWIVTKFGYFPEFLSNWLRNSRTIGNFV